MIPPSVAQRLPSLPFSLLRVGDLTHAAVANVFAGLDRVVAYPPIERRVGQFVHDLALGTQPEHWTTRIPRSYLERAHQWLNPGFVTPPQPLTRLERGEYMARHMVFSAMIAPLLGGFLYGSNPEGVRLTPDDVRTMLRRYYELLDRDAANADRVYPRAILQVAFGDLDRASVMEATYHTRRTMMAAIARREGYVAQRSTHDASKWPSYYLNLFHWRDWFNPNSALSWDSMTELLFAGLYGAMQRAALPSTLEAIDRSRPAKPVVVEVGSGTGTFAHYLLETLRWRNPGFDIRMNLVEMSPANAGLARRRLAHWGDKITFHDFENEGASAEHLPFPDESVDVMVAINLYHELPPPVRKQAATEAARTLRSGGRLVFYDSVQNGDGVDSLLTAFGESGHNKEKRKGTFHEPFIPGYAREDLVRLFRDVGLRRISPVEYAYLAKGMVFEKV